MPEIAITSPTTAEGVWAMTDYLRWPGQPPESAIRGAGYYTESYGKIDGQWLITRSAITRIDMGDASAKVGPPAAHA